jgi:hypothetical protein
MTHQKGLFNNTGSKRKGDVKTLKRIQTERRNCRKEESGGR